MASEVLSLIDKTIRLVKRASDRDEIDNVQILSAAGYEKQTFRKLVTKIDENTTNISLIPLLGLGVREIYVYPIMHS